MCISENCIILCSFFSLYMNPLFIMEHMFVVLYFNILLHFYYTIYINPYIKFLI
jgi:hypothetical protein